MTKREIKRFYDSPEWQSMRRYVLERDRWRCRVCGVPGSSDVHHKVPVIRDPSLRLDPSNLEVLCRPCHCTEDNRLRGHGPSRDRLKWLRLTGRGKVDDVGTMLDSATGQSRRRTHSE